MNPTKNKLTAKLALTLIWLALFAWRPFELGFYHDDWSEIVDFASHGSPFSPARFAPIFSLFAPRPGSAVVLFFGSSLFGASPFAWQTLSAVLALIVAFAICYFVDSLASLLDGKPEWLPGFLAACCWLTIPTTLGSTAWPVMSPGLVSAIGFLTSSIILVRFRESVLASVAGACIYCFSILTYETFYLQFIPVIILAVQLRPEMAIKHYRLRFLLWSGAQILGVVWNRVASWYAPSALSKSFNPDSLFIFLSSIVRMPLELFRAFHEVGYLALLVGSVLIVVASRRNDGLSKRSHLRTTVALIAASACALSIAMYSLAGYGLIGRGVFSRTFLGINIWCCIGAGLIFGTSAFTSRVRRTEIALFAILLLLAAIATLYRTGDWARSWQIQQTIIAAAPITEFSKLPADAVIVADVPSQIDGVTVFEAPWDISAALALSHPILRVPERSENPKGFRSFTVKREWRTTWDGTAVNQSWSYAPDSPLWKIPASEAWIWRWPANTLVRVEQPGVIN